MTGRWVEPLELIRRELEQADRVARCYDDMFQHVVDMVALTLADLGAGDSDLGNLIPQEVWDSLDQLGFLSTVRDETGEGTTVTSPSGRECLRYAIAAPTDRRAVSP